MVGMEKAMVFLSSVMVVILVANRRLMLRKKCCAIAVCRQRAGHATATSYNLH